MASIVRYFREQKEEEFGNIAASGLLDFFLEEIGLSAIARRRLADILELL